MNKGEMIERVLHKYAYAVDTDFGDIEHPGLDYETLAEQAIVIECEVEHETIGMMTRMKQTKVKHYDRLLWSDMGHHGTPGKALAIVISLEETRNELLGLPTG